MLINKMIRPRRLMRLAIPQLLGLTLWSLAAVCVYEFSDLTRWLMIPWLPLSLIGTAVAFYLGFKNNSAYDRMWEARKVWGAIVNSSRAWGIGVRAFVSNQFTNNPVDAQELQAIHRELIYRHIGWLYALRSQLLRSKPWEHASQGGWSGWNAVREQREFGVGLINDEITIDELHEFLADEEFEKVILYQNSATQLIDRQAMALQDLRQRALIDDFRHVEMQKLLNDFYVHQGKVERIKSFPLPRQYANSGSIFTYIFIMLLPFGMVSEFVAIEHFGDYAAWWSIPFTVLVGWVYYVMESIGDFSEYPFQGVANDIPMFSICRTIEIDLREMLGETELPPIVESNEGVLM